MNLIDRSSPLPLQILYYYDNAVVLMTSVYSNGKTIEDVLSVYFFFYPRFFLNKTRWRYFDNRLFFNVYIFFFFFYCFNSVSRRFPRRILRDESWVLMIEGCRLYDGGGGGRGRGRDLDNRACITDQSRRGEEGTSCCGELQTKISSRQLGKKKNKTFYRVFFCILFFFFLLLLFSTMFYTLRERRAERRWVAEITAKTNGVLFSTQSRYIHKCVHYVGIYIITYYEGYEK